jgi:choline dehydrogenase-like flavoprotein
VIGSGCGRRHCGRRPGGRGTRRRRTRGGDEPTFSGEEIDSLRRLYLEGAASATEDQALDFLAGWCLGGGTTVNWTTSLRPPDDVRAEWAGHGVPGFAGDEFTHSLDAVEQRMDVNGEHGKASGRDRVLEQGAEALGWHVAAQPRNVRGCDQNGVCGYCGFGCPLGAKQGTAETWLADAVGAGARVLVGTHARRVLVERGAAVGVDAGPCRCVRAPSSSRAARSRRRRSFGAPGSRTRRSGATCTSIP